MWDWLKTRCWATWHLRLSFIISWMGQGYCGAPWYAWLRPLPHREAQWWQHKGGEREGDGCLADWVGWMQKLSGVIHHLISGIADCSSALSALAWEVTYQISDWLFALVILHLLLTWYLLSLPGLPKDVWELSQMLSRGGRDGKNAAFVVLLWVGQAGT